MKCSGLTEHARPSENVVVCHSAVGEPNRLSIETALLRQGHQLLYLLSGKAEKGISLLGRCQCGGLIQPVEQFIGLVGFVFSDCEDPNRILVEPSLPLRGKGRK